MVTPTNSLERIYQIKVTLKDSKPPIWRLLLVPASMTLAQLHGVLQEAMGWYNCHLHQFIAAGECYGEPDPSADFDVIDERNIRLDRLLTTVRSSLVYEYDFGDSWEHKVELEKILPFDSQTTLPQCIKGSRACPPEDIGGVWGYEEFLKAIADPKHPEHEDYKEWLGEDFDPAHVDIDRINAALAGVKR